MRLRSELRRLEQRRLAHGRHNVPSSAVPSPNPSAAGAPLALSIMVGAIIGAVAHQAVLGAAIGVGVGITIAIVLWLWDRNSIGR